jgi:hypothetical protein
MTRGPGKTPVDIKQTATLVKVGERKPSGQILHIYNPENGKEVKTVQLSQAPNIFLWDQHCKKLFYSLGTSFFEMDWTLKGEPKEIFKFPKNVVPYQYAQEGANDKSVDKLLSIWRQKETNTWRLSSIKEILESYELTVFDLNLSTQTWKEISKIKTTGCFSDVGGCEMTEFKKEIFDPDLSLQKDKPQLLAKIEPTEKIEKDLLNHIVEVAKKEKIAPSEIKSRVQFSMGNGITIETGIAQSFGQYDSVSLDFIKPVRWSNGKKDLDLLSKDTGQVIFSSVGDLFLIWDVGQGSEFLFQIKTGQVIGDLNSMKGSVYWACPLSN